MKDAKGHGSDGNFGVRQSSLVFARPSRADIRAAVARYDQKLAAPQAAVPTQQAAWKSRTTWWRAQNLRAAAAANRK
jgi:hypothetical protein